MNDIAICGIPDAEFIRGQVPMTKEEVRCVTLAKLRLRRQDRCLDIGAGTGSISIEIARILTDTTVYAVEKNPEALDVIRKNIEKFQVQNIRLIAGKAPEVLCGFSTLEKIVVGGSGGCLRKIIEWSYSHLTVSGCIVINAVTLDTLADSRRWLTEYGFKQTEIIQLAVSRFEETGNSLLLKGSNPVFIISAVKE